MAYLAAAAVLIGLLVVTNLILTVGVVRRLREHTAELAALRNGDSGGSDVAMPAGSSVGGFDATSVAGLPVTLATLGDRPLVGFFSPHCQPCKERLPEFIEHATSRPGGRDAVLAVAVGAEEETAELVELLRPVATIVVEPDRGPVQQAFAVTGFPAFVLVEGGVVVASGFDLAPVTHRDTAALPAVG
ncbi:hypothetical protein ABZ260_33065 [Streptosporangium sp. NPDC006013]|uniref:TlpA family protein disulfide reductase n=1 Tax=Streptosporangium sp. NPDC006013 TaxID=3155596 RepID=UPI0033B701DC